MSSLAKLLIASDNCQADYKLQNPIVILAYNDLIAYLPVYMATCLKNPTTNAYCFASAVTNTSSPTSSYVYYLPLGAALPGGTTPTCDACLQEVMQGFAGFATNATQPISKTYDPAVQQIEMFCGPTFVNTTVRVTSGVAHMYGIGLSSGFAMIASYVFLFG